MHFFGFLFLIVYFAMNIYIGYNGWIWLNSKFTFTYKKTYILVIGFLSVSFILGRILELKLLDTVGSYWMIVVGYSFVILPVATIIYFALKRKGKFQIGIGVLVFFAFIFIYGSYNAWNTTVRNYEVFIDNKSDMKELKVLLVSDIHIGEKIGTNNLLQMVDIVKEQNPDIVLMAGDIINNDIEPYLTHKIEEIMNEIKAPLGVYAVPGNHDYYEKNVDSLANELEKSGIHFLQDEVINVNGLFYIVGRKDFTEEDRKQISELVANLDQSKPIIMLDHQPRELGAAQKSGVDIIVSGHTHRGQLFPANFITDSLFENDWGYLQKGQLHSFTSSGLGLWGPELRIGSQSEVMVIDVIFK